MKLYKFAPINKYSLLGLANRTFYCAKPSSFNDPYEFEFNEKVCSDAYLEHARIEHGTVTVSEFSASELREQLREAIKEKIDSFGVVCLSERDDSPLMWGHYAQSQKGMCLEFSVAEDDNSVFPVCYCEALPILDDPSSSLWSRRNALKPLVTKHVDWSYERERRILREEGGRSFNYPESFKLLSVAFGVRCSSEDIDLVKCVLSGTKVQFRQAFLDRSTYKISFRNYRG